MTRTKTVMGAAAVAAAALIGLTAGCTPSMSPSSTRPPVTISASASATGFVSIVEPWDPGHPAQIETAQGDCYYQEPTADNQQCFQAKTENIDAEIDAVQQARYDSASPSEQATILAQDNAWLNARGTVCEAAFHTEGSIDQDSTGACLVDESTARLDAVKGIAPLEAVLQSTDNLDPNVWSWYTTPEGSRIAMLSTQGDQSGGGIIRWTIIGGADGFVVNPSQFYFSDGSYTNSGVVQPLDPAYHRVGAGQEYSFSIDYTRLSAAPTGNPAQGFVYAPGAPVAIWQ